MRKQDQSIEQAWSVFLGLMIFSAACVAVMLMYSAFFAALGSKWAASSTYLAMASGLATGVWWLAYHRNEITGLN